MYPTAVYHMKKNHKLFMTGFEDGRTDRLINKGDYHKPLRVNQGSKIENTDELSLRYMYKSKLKDRPRTNQLTADKGDHYGLPG